MDISWTWLGIVVLALIIFACASGFRRGFVKEIVSGTLTAYDANGFKESDDKFASVDSDGKVTLFRVTARNWSWNRQAARKLWIKKNRRR